MSINGSNFLDFYYRLQTQMQELNKVDKDETLAEEITDLFQDVKESDADGTVTIEEFLAEAKELYGEDIYNQIKDEFSDLIEYLAGLDENKEDFSQEDVNEMNEIEGVDIADASSILNPSNSQIIVSSIVCIWPSIS